MILKYRRINPRDIKITIVLLVYMPILGAVGLMVKSDLIIDIAMTIPLLFSIIFMLRYNYLFVIRYIVWIPRNIRSIVFPRECHEMDPIRIQSLSGTKTGSRTVVLHVNTWHHRHCNA